MSFLTVNSLEIPCFRDTVSAEDEAIGEATRRAYDGTLRSSVRARKQRINVETPPQVYATAEQIKRLLRGEGRVWDFESATRWRYESRGGAFIEDASVGRSTTRQQYGAASLLFGLTAYVRIPRPTIDGFVTVAYWRYDSSWQHWTYVIEIGVAGSTRYLNGVATGSFPSGVSISQVSTSPDFIEISGDGGKYMDDLVLLPYQATPEMVAAIAGHGQAYSRLPQVHVSGEVIDDGQITARCVDAISEDYRALSDGATWRSNQRVIRGSLAEV